MAGAPRQYQRATPRERIEQLRSGEVDVETGLNDPDEAVRFEAELLSDTGPDYTQMRREQLEQLARDSDNDGVLADIYAEAKRRNDHWLMMAVANNRNTDPDTLRACEQSGLPGCRAAALNRLWEKGLANTEELTATGSVDDRIAVAKRAGAHHPEIAEAMADDTSPRVRRMVALVAGGLVGAAVARRLATDPDRATRRNLAACATDEDALATLTDDEDSTVAKTAADRLAQVRGEKIASMEAEDVVAYVREMGRAEVELPGGRYTVTNAEVYQGEAVLFAANDSVSRASSRAGLKECYDSSPEGKQVTVPTDDELAQYKSLMTTTDGLAGVGVKEDGEIAALYSNSPKRGVTGPLFDAARDEGGKFLECFDTYLPKVYAKNGFVPVARIPFNREYAPDGWDYAAMGRYNDGCPDLVFMVTATVGASGRYSDEPLGVLFADWDEAHDYVTERF